MTIFELAEAAKAEIAEQVVKNGLAGRRPGTVKLAPAPPPEPFVDRRKKPREKKEKPVVDALRNPDRYMPIPDGPFPGKPKWWA